MARLNPTERKPSILAAAMMVAETQGFNTITREAIAKQAGIAPSLINQYFGNMRSLKRVIMRRAVKYRILPIILDGIVTRNPIALSAPEQVKKDATNLLDD